MPIDVRRRCAVRPSQRIVRRIGRLASVIAVMLGALAWQAVRSRRCKPDRDTQASDGSRLPLKPIRAEHFRVTEGTWVSLDVSPDGQTIIFDLLGDLYTLPITGGTATRLTTGTALNHQPRFSPDGRQVVFISDRGGSDNVWIADRDGRHARQLSDLHGAIGSGAATSPAWSPDGRSVVVSQQLRATRLETEKDLSPWWLLAVYDVQTGRMHWVSDTVRSRARSALGPVFTPDGRGVYAAVDVTRKDMWREVAGWRIARVDITTGHIEPEMGGNVGRVGMRPAVSPDGRYLVYATSSGSHVGLRLRDLQTDRERWLVREALDDPPYQIVGPRDLVPGYAFTPDAKALIIANGGKIHRIDLATGRRRTIPFEVEVERALGALSLHQFSLPDTAVRTRSIMYPALSPDGRWVAFSALDRIWVMQLPHDAHPAGTPHRLTANSIGEFYPSWSPDGRWITYSTWQDGEGGALRRARVPRGEQGFPVPSERLTLDTATYFQTAVAPDGERVVGVRASATAERSITSWHLEPADFQLVWVPASGGTPRSIRSLATEYSRYFRYPTDQVYFTSDPSRIYVGLKSWSWDGQPVTASDIVGREPSGGGFFFSDPYDFAGVLSPDRRRVLIARQYALFELTLPQSEATGQDTLDLDRARLQPFGTTAVAAHRWGSALAPWITWSRDARRVLFNQGGTLFIGDVSPDAWTKFTRVDVQLPIPVDVPRGTLVLHGARLITMHGHEVIEHGDLIVHDNRIVALGPAGHVAIPAGAHTLNLFGATILPGYIDVHDHPRLVEGVHPQQLWGGLVRLAHGVTTYRDPAPGWGNDVFAYRERERTGELLGPRMFTTGIPYYGTDPPIRTLADAVDRVQPNAEYFDTETFKIYYNLSTDRRARQLLAMAVGERGLNATTHTDGLELQVEGIIDGLSGIEHPPEVPIYDDVATLIALSGTTHTQTYSGLVPGSLPYVIRRYGSPWTWARMRRFIPPPARPSVCFGCSGEGAIGFSAVELDNLLPLVRGAARIVNRGGRVAMGAHGNVPGIGFHWEMWLHALGGMSNHDILRSATIIGAGAIGHLDDLGSLEPGKLADLQILDRSPLERIRNTVRIRYVMKNGRLYRAEDLTEIWPRRRVLSSMYLWEASPVTARGGGNSSNKPVSTRSQRRNWITGRSANFGQVRPSASVGIDSIN